MTRSYRKNTLRTFKNTLSRFAAVFAIVALGVGFLAGLSGTPIDMKESMERYMDDADFYDLRVVSTLGLTDEDVAALGQVDGVREVQPGYSADLLVEADGDTIVSRAHSLPAPDNNTINRLRLVDGRLPAACGECVVEAGAMELNPTYPIGTQLVVSSANEALDTKLDTTVYTVVGIVHNANYFSFEREPASVGNGTVKLVFYIPQQDFAFEAYTEIYLTAEGALAQDSLGDDYRDTVDAVKARVEGIADAARFAEIVVGHPHIYDIPAEADVTEFDAQAKKGVLSMASKCVCDGERCLQCSTVCENCVDSCPNRANVVIKMADGSHEIVHVDKMCNECGNCTQFCPYASEPCHDKFTLFQTKEDMDESENYGVLFEDDDMVRLRYEDGVKEYDLASCDNDLPVELEALILTVRDKYSYLYL